MYLQNYIGVLEAKILNSCITDQQSSILGGVCRYVKVPAGNFGVYDPTEIHRLGQLKTHMRDSVIGLGYYLVFFFIYLYW